MANSTPYKPIRAFDRRQVGTQIAAYEANKADDGVALLHWWRKEVRIGDFTASAATSQEIDLHDDLTAVAQNRDGQSGDFPDNALLFSGAVIRNITDWSGGAATSATVEVGDTGDPNALLSSTSVFTGVGAGYLATTPTANEYLSSQPALIPTLTITSDVNIDTLTAGALEVLIPYYLLPRDTDAA